MLVSIGLFTSLLVISPFTSQANAAPAREYRLAKVSVAGSHRFTEGRIVQVSGLHVGDAVTQEDLQAAANRLGATRAFLSVAFQFRTEGEDLSVAYQVEDARRFLRCAYDNFVWFTANEINQAIQQEVVLFDGSLAENDEVASAVAGALERFVHARGLNGAVTFVKVGEFGKPVVAYLFKLEGNPVVVASMDVVGPLEASFFSEERTRLVGKPYSSHFANLLAEKNLKQIYQNHGYLRAEFAQPTTTLLRGTQQGAPDQVGVTFNVISGLQYSWDHVEWDGNRALPKDTLEKLLGMHAHEIAAANKVAKGFDAVLRE